MIVHDLEPIGRWYFVAVYYPTAQQAKVAWKRADRYRQHRPLGEAIGIVRTTPPMQGPGTMPSGAPPNTHPVIALTTDEAVAQHFQRLLQAGTPWTPVDLIMDALIGRLAYTVTHSETGTHRVRRPDDAGIALDAEGNVFDLPRQGRSK